MAIGDSPEMQRMQEQAMQRAREMYLRAHPELAEPEKNSAEEPAVETKTRRQQANPKQVPLSQGRNTSTAQSSGNSNNNKTASQNAATQPQSKVQMPSEPVKSTAAPQKPDPQIQAALNSPSIINTLMEDKDRTLILMLLVMLSGQEQNNELMFALLYLLM